MTIGYPDDQAYPSWTAPLIANFNAVVPASSLQNIYQGVVGNYASLHLHIGGNAPGLNTLLSWFPDSTFGAAFTQQSIWTTAVTAADLVVPLLSPYLKIDVQTALGGSGDVIVQATPINVPVARPTYQGGQNYIAQAITAVPLSTTASLFQATVQPGLAWFMFEPQDATGKLTVEIAIGAGVPSANNKVFHLAGATAEIDRLVVLPDVPVQVNIINTDGTAAHSYRAALVPAGSTG